MKTTLVSLTLLAAIILAACGTSKKATVAAPAPALPPVASAPLILAPPAGGLHAPGDEELTAIRALYKETTMEQLKDGHYLYTQGACIGCHSAFNIYNRPQEQWKHIIDDMAYRAGLSGVQKDAVYKYVLAMKSTQPR